jgi:aryl-alcohol dehydrogenase-like predicted oxidoreductase
MTFGDDWGWGASVAESKAMIDRYMDAGGNFIDTANMYTKGHSEVIVGEHVGSVPSKRRRMVIATKFFGNLFPGDPNAGGTSRKAIASACEDSLRRLRTDSIDLYWMHCFDPITPIDETMRALDDVSAPSLDFPAEFVARAGVFSHGGTTINGKTWPVLPNAPKGDDDRY